MKADLTTPFQRVLVANRGEIALRIQRSAHESGLQTVAVFSDADADAQHVRAADFAVRIGGGPPAESYLNIAALIDAAHISGADAVHPGYGFLAENAAFAQACVDAGLVFVGPSAEAITEMGDKAGAKRLMADADIPCVPGYLGADQSDTRLLREAEAIGCPVMIKATAGGGGRGMRRVDALADFLPTLHSARSEARNAFGNDTVLLERALTNPRHVEVQILADRYGTVLHLGERDCSVQRRHQKLIEETPSPAVSAAVRAEMGAAAVAAARSIRYEGAGTIEFLLDADGRFYFMEMNTRLQVEHAVTEAVTGIDIVAWQLRIAAGERLILTQGSLSFTGHSIEVRLCAEDAAHQFVPQSGTIGHWRAGRDVQIEHALASGAAIPPFYDSMIAKVIAHGATREEARRRLSRGLRDTAVLGIRTNRDFLLRCLAHPAFVREEVTTGFVGDHLSDLGTTDGTAQSQALALAAALFGMHAEDTGAHAGWANRWPAPLVLRIDTGGTSEGDHPLQVARDAAGACTVNSKGVSHTVRLIARDGADIRFECDGLQAGATVWRDGTTLWLDLAGRTWCIKDRSRSQASGPADRQHDGRLRAALNGRVVALHCATGDTVEVGQPILTLEAMKMEHVHTAPVVGVLTALLAELQTQAGAGQVLAEITSTAVTDAAAPPSPKASS